jgi:hypothetical protein
LNRFGAIAISALLITACTNGQSVIGLGGGSTTAASGTTTNDSLGSALINLQTVVVDPNVAGTLDLVGDGTNDIGTDCTAAASTTSTSYQGAGVSNCVCLFTFQVSATDTATLSVQVNTSYYEANMLECPYNQIPAGAVNPTVAIYNSSTAATISNPVTVPLSGANAAVDLTNPINFTQMQRYQCKDIVTIMMPWADGQGPTAANVMYDPFQSSDPDISYPLNFYTINFGGTFSQIAANQIENWSCPGLPNDPSVSGLDLRLWSLSPDSAGSSEIYPPVGSAFDRSTFYVSNQAAGVFTLPLNTYIAPTLYGGNGALPPSGYGAPSTAGSTAGTETCPTGATIPAGYQWAKLWLFRAGLADRYFDTSAAIESTNVQCNPGIIGGSGNPTVAFSDCGTTAIAGDPEGGVTVANSAPASPRVILADRIISGEGSYTSGGNQAVSSTTSACVNVDGSAVAAPGFSCALGETNEGPGCWTGTETTARYAAGTDKWDTRQRTAVGGGGATSGTTVTLDPLNLYITSNNGTNAAGSVDVPVDVNPGKQDLDEVSGVSQSRYDYVFVVSPVTLMSGQMGLLNTTPLASTISYPYTPYRFPSKQDCQSSNPNNPSFAGDCNPSKIIHYQTVANDISTPVNSQDATQVYPMCVLQPIP